jgi:hypothetical protein
MKELTRLTPSFKGMHKLAEGVYCHDKTRTIHVVLTGDLPCHEAVLDAIQNGLQQQLSHSSDGDPEVILRVRDTASIETLQGVRKVVIHCQTGKSRPRRFTSARVDSSVGAAQPMR